MLQQRKYWIINDHEPTLARSTHFDVKEGSVQLTAGGLAVGEVLDIEVRVDGALTRQPNVDHYWAKLWRHGWRVQLRSDHNQLVINIPGTYRVVRSTPTAGPIAVAVWESDHKFEMVENNAPKGSPASDAGDGGGDGSPETIVDWECAAPRLPLGDTVISVERCTAAGEPVTVFLRVTRPDNSQCPPVPGTVQVVGYMDAVGAYGNGTPPGGFGPCNAECPPMVAQGVISTWG